MKLKVKSFLILTLCLSFLINTPLTVQANIPHPQEFWGLSPLYTQALQDNHHVKIIEYGTQILSLYDGRDDENAKAVLAPRYQQIAKAYEALSDYTNALKYYKLHIPLAEYFGWDDGVNYSKNKVAALSLEVELFVKDTSTQTYTGALYEPEKGIIFGSAHDLTSGEYKWAEISKRYTKQESGYMIYVNFGTETAIGFDRYFQDAKSYGMGAQVGWNVDDLQTFKNIKNYEKYIHETVAYLDSLEIPIFLRFGGEMNIADFSTDASAFINAFQFVADIVHKNSSRIAMVWSPNDVNAHGRTYDMYYPGDDYVDWVGMSTYTYKYFGGVNTHGHMTEIYDVQYLTGDYANPLKRIYPVIEAYGDRKPILISENGISHYAKLLKEDLSDWASVQLKRLYIYGPMLYPQLKGIFYFNVNSEAGHMTNTYNYALHSNNKLQDTYNKAVANDYFLSSIGSSSIGSSSTFSYVSIQDKTFDSKKIELNTYSIVPKVLKPTIKYVLNGQVIATKTDIPYTASIDFSSLDISKSHTLDIQVYDGNTLLRSKPYRVSFIDNKLRLTTQQEVSDVNDFNTTLKLKLSNAITLQVDQSYALIGSDSLVQVDATNLNVKPFVVNGNTLVPMRFIAESLGATVQWNGTTQTATITKGTTKVEMVLNQKTMLVNGQSVNLNVAPMLKDSRTFLPLRALSEALGKEVFYHRGVIILSDTPAILDLNTESIYIDWLRATLR